jgi:peroxiredoxin
MDNSIFTIGDKIPDVILKFMGPDGLSNIKSSDLFQGKRIAVFGAIGAYGPVCSTVQLPGVISVADQLLEKGIDGIVCIAVNDPFVMKAWGSHHGTGHKVAMISDHDGQFTKAIGVAIDLTEPFGFGQRSKRYSMIVNDGAVEKFDVEEDLLECEVSSAKMMVQSL